MRLRNIDDPATPLGDPLTDSDRAAVSAVAFAPNQPLLASVDDGTVRL